jgi:hypothetical protein
MMFLLFILVLCFATIQIHASEEPRFIKVDQDKFVTFDFNGTVVKYPDNGVIWISKNYTSGAHGSAILVPGQYYSNVLLTYLPYPGYYNYYIQAGSIRVRHCEEGNTDEHCPDTIIYQDLDHVNSTIELFVKSPFDAEAFKSAEDYARLQAALLILLLMVFVFGSLIVLYFWITTVRKNRQRARAVVPSLSEFTSETTLETFGSRLTSRDTYEMELAYPPTSGAVAHPRL